MLPINPFIHPSPYKPSIHPVYSPTHPSIRPINPSMHSSTQSIHSSFNNCNTVEMHVFFFCCEFIVYIYVSNKCAVPTSVPQNLSVDDVNDTSVTLNWRSPENIGSGLDGYTVEYCREGCSEWVVANSELITSSRFVISGLTAGDLLNIRVVAVNAGGRSEPVALPQPVPVREIVGECLCTVGRRLELHVLSLDLSKINKKNKMEKLLLFTNEFHNDNPLAWKKTIQSSAVFWQEWFTVLEHFHRLNATVSDLVMGNTYTFRVFAENKVGRSETAAVTKGAAHIQKTGIVYKPAEYKEHDFSEAPKFTAPLSNRAATVGYTTKLLCAVRGSPKPTIEWLKNQMLIGDDPKYRQINNQGVCSLEIRKPSSFDGGVYTCRAKNALGEATVVCKLEVKQVIISDEKERK
uniref:Myosin binding protein Ha n=1 Tax=Sinocyclocheilus grahami TaxID=75366 RepID=A0A672S8L5_SINGR